MISQEPGKSVLTIRILPAQPGKRPKEATYRVDKPEFFSTNNSFRVVIKNVNYKLDVNGSNTGSSDDPVNGPVKLTEKEQKVIELIMTNPNITRMEMAEAIGCSMSTVKRAISSLVDKKILEREGSDKAGSWIVHI